MFKLIVGFGLGDVIFLVFFLVVDVDDKVLEDVDDLIFFECKLLDD